jgi:nicotinamidase-related amidase
MRRSRRLCLRIDGGKSLLPDTIHGAVHRPHRECNGFFRPTARGRRPGWKELVLPVVASLAGRHPERTLFTRFIPPERPDELPGMWQRYYTRWRLATREHLDLDLLELMPPLAALCPPAADIDKTRYSGFAEPKLLAHLREREADALIISGSETDVCVLATVLSAVDLGYRVIVVRDAVCSSSDEGHDMLLRLYHTRFSEQIETADAATILSRWH